MARPSAYWRLALTPQHHSGNSFATRHIGTGAYLAKGVIMGRQLVTSEQCAQLLAIGELRNAGQSIDPMSVVKLLTPDAHATWLRAALDPSDGDTAWGLVDPGIGMPALATIKLSDLAEIVGPKKRPVLRDLYFRATRRIDSRLIGWMTAPWSTRQGVRPPTMFFLISI